MSDPYWSWNPETRGDMEFDLTSYGVEGKATVSMKGYIVRIDGIPELGILSDEIAYRVMLRYYRESGSSIPAYMAVAMHPIRKKEAGQYAENSAMAMDYINISLMNVTKMAERGEDLEKTVSIGSDMIGYSRNYLEKIKNKIPEDVYQERLRGHMVLESYMRSVRMLI